MLRSSNDHQVGYFRNQSVYNLIKLQSSLEERESLTFSLYDLSKLIKKNLCLFKMYFFLRSFKKKFKKCQKQGDFYHKQPDIWSA